MRPNERRRSAFHQSGGSIDTSGDRVAAARLADAWRAATGDGREWTHGFHAYPARVHPGIVRSLIAAYSRPGDVVLDPFAGSGTVLVEALAAGRRGLGGDVNPIAVAIAREKVARSDAASRRALEETAERVARPRRSRRDETLEFDDDPLFRAYVRSELGALAAGIVRVSSAARRRTLEMVLSSILVKVSRRRSETDARSKEGGVPPGATTHLFVERALELTHGRRDLERAVPPGAPSAFVALADARALPFRDRSVDLVLTSPPYLGTYDYAETQELRAAAFGTTMRGARRREIGARADAAGRRRDAVERFVDDLAAALAEIRRVSRPGARTVMILGDSIAGGARVDAAHVLDAAARKARLAFVAIASQHRPQPDRRSQDAFARHAKREHIVLLRRPD